MSGRDADMKRVDRGLLRQSPSVNQLARQLRGLVGERETPNPAKSPQTAGPHGWIAKSGLIEHNLRDEHVVGSPASPPAPSERLVSGDDDVTARSSAQITDDARLDVDAGSRGLCTSDVIRMISAGSFVWSAQRYE